MRREIEAADFSARAAHRRRVPEPEIIGGIKSSTVADGDIGSIIGVQLVLPLFDRARPEKARAAGVDVTLEVWDDMVHDFQLFAADLPDAQRAIEGIGSFIRDRLT